MLVSPGTAGPSLVVKLRHELSPTAHLFCNILFLLIYPNLLPPRTRISPAQYPFLFQTIGDEEMGWGRSDENLNWAKHFSSSKSTIGMELWKFSVC